MKIYRNTVKSAYYRQSHTRDSQIVFYLKSIAKPHPLSEYTTAKMQQKYADSKTEASDTGVTTPTLPTDESLGIDDIAPPTGHLYGSVEPHVFSSSARAEHWKNIYEDAKYECRHRFDPSFQWSHQGEVLVKKKVEPVNFPAPATVLYSPR